MNGTLDDCKIWSGDLGATAILSDYNNITTPAAPLTANATLYTNMTQNGNFTFGTVPFFFNGTVTNTVTTGFNCTLYYNDSQNYGGATSTYANFDLSKWNSINLTDTGTEWWTTLLLNCTNVNASATIKRDIFIDNVVPTAAFKEGETYTGALKQNGSIKFRYMNNENDTAWAMDTNLFAVNLTLKRLNPDGSTNATLSNILVQNLNSSVSPYGIGLVTNGNGWWTNPNYTNGKYAYLLTVWDSHTDRIVRNMTQFLATNMIGLDDITFSSGDIKTYNSKNATVSYFYLATDRYKVKMTFQGSSLVHKVNITTGGKLTYLPTSNYKGHFVYFEKGKWIDFMGANVDYVESRKLADNKYEVTIHLKVASDEVELESIGDLNRADAYWTFNITDPTRVYAKDLYTNISLTNFTATLINGSGVVVQKSLAPLASFIPFNQTGTYDVNITALQYVTYNASSQNFNGTNYTYYLTASNSLYVTVYDEQTNTIITDRSVSLEVINFANQSYSYNLSSGYTFIYGFPAGSYEVRAFATDYPQRSYYTTIVGSDTQVIRMYLLSSASNETTTYKNVFVLDENGRSIANATVSMYKFFIDCNCYRPVEMAKTNDDGQTFTYAQLYDMVYKFYISIGGSTKKITSETRLDNRDLYIYVVMSTNELKNFLDVGAGVLASMDYNATSGSWEYSFVDDSGIINSGRLLVTSTSSTGDITVLFNQSAAGTTSTIVYDGSAYVNKTGHLRAVGFVNTTAGEEFLVARMDYEYDTSSAVFGLQGLFLTMLIVLVVALIGAYNPVVSIALCMGGLFITRAIGLYYVSTAWLIGVAITGLIVALKVRT